MIFSSPLGPWTFSWTLILPVGEESAQVQMILWATPDCAKEDDGKKKKKKKARLPSRNFKSRDFAATANASRQAGPSRPEVSLVSHEKWAKMGCELSTKRRRNVNEAYEPRRNVSKAEAGGADRNGERFQDSGTSRQEKCYDPQDPTLTFVDGEDQLDCK